MSAKRLNRAGALVAGVGVVCAALPAQAGGLILPITGVRASGRGGAFVAGADDGEALWYNPAGLAAMAGGKEKVSIYFDMAVIQHPLTYSRVDSGGNEQPAVENDPQPLPHPFIVGSFDLGSRFVLSAGVITPYASLDGYPEDGAQRYQLVSLHHTVLAFLDVALGWKVSDKLWLGAGLSNMIVGFNTRVTFSSCPSEIACAPEDPDWDALGELQQQDPFNLAVVLGATFIPSDKLRLALSVRSPYYISASGTIAVRLPATGFFDGSHIEGDSASMEMVVPAMVRAGAEARLHERVRTEFSFGWEMWSMHESIDIVPDGIRIEDQAGVGIYELGKLSIPRNLKDTFSFALGLEAQPLATQPLMVRLGYTYETGAAPDEYMSLLTPDSNKHVLSAGLGYRFGRFRLDALFSHSILATRDIGLDTTCVPLQNPIRTGEGQPVDLPCEHPAEPDPQHVYVGAGKYESSYTVFGLGVNAAF